MTLGTTLSLRLAAIVLVGFVLLQFIVFGAMTLPTLAPEPDPPTSAYNLPPPADMAAVVEALEAASPRQRALLVHTLDASFYSITMEPAMPALPPAQEPKVVALGTAYRAALPGHRVEFSARSPLVARITRISPWPGRFLEPATLAIALHSGGTLMLVSRPSALLRDFLRQRAGLGAATGLLLLLCLAWAVRQTTRPITMLALNIRAFSTQLDAPDLPATGAPELRELTLAYREMKGRIAELLAERTRILAGIAHDMRTYLTRLRLRAEFIEDADQRQRAASDLADMALLLDDTLLFAQPVAAGRVLERLDLMAEVTGLVTLRRDMGDAVELVNAAGTVIIRADRLALRRALGNLIDNGLRHGNRVVLEVLTPTEGTVPVLVTDDGPGVPPEMLDRLGQAFGRLDPSRDRTSGGAGLGLAIVRALMDRQGGSVSFRNGAEGGLEASLSFQTA
jgi:signal transduction histidine kinase